MREYCKKCKKRLLWSAGKKVCATKSCPRYGKTA